MKRLRTALGIGLCCGSAAAALRDWSGVDAVLLDAIAREVFPGCAAAVTDSTGNAVYLKTFGNYTYGIPTPVGKDVPPVTVDSLFDMASITKILGATTASALLYQRGLLDLDAAVSSPSLLGPAYAANGKGSIRIRDLLMHQAGYPPDPDPGYSTPEFGCPATSLPSPPLTFNCSEQIFASLLAQTLQYPPGSMWLYSDLSMITMQYVIGTIVASNGLVPRSALRPDCGAADAQRQPGLYKTCYFEAFVRVEVLGAIADMDATQFLIPPSEYASAVPTWNDTYYRFRVMQGQVSDENSYALGGIAGHAGIFSRITDMLSFVNMWQFGSQAQGEARAGPFTQLINASTAALFTRNPDPSFGPRALGWVTQASTDPYLGCGNWSASTYYHTGYTGTLLCADPVRNITCVLLTNRVYPNSTANADGVHAARQAFANAVLAALG